VRLRFERRRWCHFRDDLADTELTPLPNVVPQAHLGERSVGQVAEPGKTPLQDAAGTAANPNVPSSEHFERESGRAYQVSDLVREEPEAFVLASEPRAHESLIAASVLCDTTRDGVIQASVQGAEVFDADGLIQEEREFGNGLAHLPIIVYDLRQREPVQLKVTAMECRALADLRVR
jgi:hypothetical protein